MTGGDPSGQLPTTFPQQVMNKKYSLYAPFNFRALRVGGTCPFHMFCAAESLPPQSPPLDILVVLVRLNAVCWCWCFAPAVLVCAWEPVLLCKVCHRVQVGSLLALCRSVFSVSVGGSLLFCFLYLNRPPSSMCIYLGCVGLVSLAWSGLEGVAWRRSA